MDAGGAMSLPAGGYVTSSTIGQPDAGAVSKDGYELRGGFWPVAADIPSCGGDCDENGKVTIREIHGMIKIALGSAPVATCTAGDSNRDGRITIDELVSSVNRASLGC